MWDLTKVAFMRSLLFVGLLLVAVPVLAGDGLAPDFTLKSRGGENIKLSELRGEVVMLNFWASWCGPCRQEMPLLDGLYRRYKAMGFRLLGVNVDEDSAAARALLDEIPVSFTILFDPRNRLADRYAIEAMPTTILIDRDGRRRYTHLGYVPGTEQDYEREIKALIRE